MQLSIVIPVFNSKSYVESSVAQLCRSLQDAGINFEILLFDDGSKDGVQEVFSAVEERYSCVKTYSSRQNYGLGYALKFLIKKARGEFIVYLDIDLPFGAEVVKELYQRSETADVLIASRYLKPNSSVPVSRLLASRLYYSLCKFLFNVTVKDIGSGSVGVHAYVFDRLLLNSNGFDIHIEFLIKAYQNKMIIKEFSFPSKDFRKGSFHILKHGPRVFVDTIKFWFEVKERGRLKAVENNFI